MDPADQSLQESAMRFNDLKISRRLGVMVSLMTLLIILLGVTAFTSLNNVADEWSSFSNIALQKRQQATRGEIALGDAIHNFKDYLLRGGDYDKKFMDNIADVNAAAAGYEDTRQIEPHEKALLDEVRKGTVDYVVALNKMREMKAAGTGIEQIDQSIKGADKAIGQPLHALLKIAADETAGTGKRISALVSDGKQWVIGVMVLMLIVAPLFAWRVSRSITNPLNDAVRIAQAVAAGDLGSRIEVRYKDETGQLLQALKDMNENLTRIVSEVRTGTDTISAASQDVASGNLDLSSRTEEQASSLEETASSMEQLTATVRQNAENARQANELAISAADVAVKGGDVVSRVVDTMNSINASSKKTVDIISVIDGIAFQTNILALNAAVEAARAGEQGRGFAVVASEVRNLAQRSAAAAKEIKVLISDSVEKVGAGTALVDQAGVTMDEVVSSIKRVTQLMADTAAASEEESAGLEQINKAIIQMDQITQQNAALVEEAAAASDSMQGQAANLAAAVSVFKLGGTMNATQATQSAAVSSHSAAVRLASRGDTGTHTRRIA
jgi:methyl-accepting chemotaxis protein